MFFCRKFDHNGEAEGKAEDDGKHSPKDLFFIVISTESNLLLKVAFSCTLEAVIPSLACVANIRIHSCWVLTEEKDAFILKACRKVDAEVVDHNGDEDCNVLSYC